MIDDLINGGIFGPTLAGKTTLAKKLCALQFAQHKRRSLVLDPWTDSWGEHAEVFHTNQQAEFWVKVWSSQNQFVIVDEAATTISRDSDLVPAFTQMRHNGHRFLVIGHNGVDLLPAMRHALHYVFLFRQSEPAARCWVDEFAEPQIEDCARLQQYEFLYCRRFKPPQRVKLTK
jgi:hypothetical protein